jgi:ribose transport system ATP-binding protein
MRDGRTVTTVDLADTSEEQLVTAMIGRAPTHRLRPPSDVGSRPPRLELRRVRIPGVLDVEGITVAPGEIVGLAGLGGAGRTTLLSAIFGGCPAELDAGLDGRPLHAGRPAAAVRAGIGLVPEDRKGQGLLRELSVHRNAGLAALRPAGLMPGRNGAAAALTPLRALGVKYADGNQPVGQLSGGNQQKVVLAKWMARGIKVLLLDEPTRGLDIGAKEDLFTQVQRLADEGVAVLLASSELPELIANADTVWVLYEGRNVARYDPHATSEEQIARTVVTGSPQT